MVMYIDQLSDSDAAHHYRAQVVNNDLCHRLNQVLRIMEFRPHCCQLPTLSEGVGIFKWVTTRGKGRYSSAENCNCKLRCVLYPFYVLKCDRVTRPVVISKKINYSHLSNFQFHDLSSFISLLLPKTE